MFATIFTMRSFYSLYPSVSMIYNVVAFYVVHYKVSKICSLSIFVDVNLTNSVDLSRVWYDTFCAWLMNNKGKLGTK